MKRLIRMAVIVIAAIIAIAAVLWWLSWMPPRWYQPPDAHDADAGELAALVEHRLAEELHNIRDDGAPWQIRIRESHVNAWLATRMPRWLEHERGVEWPDRLGTPQVRFDPQRVSIAVPVRRSGSSTRDRSHGRTFTVTLEPTLDQSELRFALTGIRVGRLPVPGDPQAQLARFGPPAPDAGESDFAAYLRQLVHGAVGVDPTLTLVDDRQIIMTEVRVGRGVLDLTMLTTPAPNRRERK